jgi:pimeloyl-ACP methyl ester carboxylesterase
MEIPPPPSSAAEFERAVDVLGRRALESGGAGWGLVGRYLVSIDAASLKALMKRRQLELCTVEGVLRGAAAIARAGADAKGALRAVAAVCVAPGAASAADLLSAEDLALAAEVVSAGTAAGLLPKACAKIAKTFGV